MQFASSETSLPNPDQVEIGLIDEFRADRQTLLAKQAKKRKISLAFGGIGLISLIGIGIAIQLNPKLWVFIFMSAFPILGSIIFEIVMAVNRGVFHKTYSLKIKGAVVNALIGKHSYYPQGKLSEADLENSKLVSSWDRYLGEDLVEGEWEGASFRFSDVHLEKESTSTDSDGNTTTNHTTVFKGIFFVIDTKIDLGGFYQIMQSDRSGIFYDSKIVKGFLQAFKFMESNNRIRLESEEYDDQFKVFSDRTNLFDGEKAYPLLDSLLELRRNFGSHINLSVRNETIYLSVSRNQDLFRMVKISKLDEGQLIHQFYQELESCLQVIKMLKKEIELHLSASEASFFEAPSNQNDTF